jgi:two-component system sensor histidine kinase KdpD
MTDPDRPDPERLLARLQEEQVRSGRGRLKVFLGAYPGAGKTFAMLEAARAARAAGRDVVVGVVETHGRAETEALLQGLEVLPRRIIDHRGVPLTEFDLDGAIARRPALLLVDELAHTNAPESRHARRWQDVHELLAHGIDVHTTLNIQHIESLNDVVAQLTGVIVRETVPDSVLDEADELELVDVSPEVLEERLRTGRVYLPAQAAQALDRFFRRGNLIALRELALRRTAQQVDAAMREWREDEGVDRTLPATERVLVAVPIGSGARRLVRSGWRLAQALHAECIAIHIETPEVRRLPDAAREEAVAALRLAEGLGARPVTLTADRPADELLAFARRENVTRIVVGRPLRRWRLPWRGSLAEHLVSESDAVDIHVVPLRLEGARRRHRQALSRKPRARDYMVAAAWVLLAAAIGFPVRGVVSTTDVAMLFLLAVTVAAARTSPGAGVAAAALSIVLFDLIFVPPYYAFAVSDARYVLTFAVMLGVAIAMARLTSRIRDQAVAARAREQRTAALLAYAQELAEADGTARAVEATVKRLRDSLGAQCSVQLVHEGGGVQPAPGGDFPALDAREATVARWAVERRAVAGAGTATLPTATLQWFPLVAGAHVLGAVGVTPPGTTDGPDRQQFVEAIVGQLAVALDRERLAERTARDQVAIEAERLRTALLSSLSHDLRTPLGAVEGAADTLLQRSDLEEPVRRGLLESIILESRRMGRLIGNLLEMVRLESGSLEVQAEWQSVDELVGMALLRTEEQLAQHRVITDLAPGLPLLKVDGVLIEQVLVNLLENAGKYAPRGTTIRVSAAVRDHMMEIVVDDEGPGVPIDEQEAIFDKFHRAGASERGGSGLGLTICRGIVTAHGGSVSAEASPAGGLRVTVRLPLPDHQPTLDPAEPMS